MFAPRRPVEHSKRHFVPRQPGMNGRPEVGCIPRSASRPRWPRRLAWSSRGSRPDGRWAAGRPIATRIPGRVLRFLEPWIRYPDRGIIVADQGNLVSRLNLWSTFASILSHPPQILWIHMLNWDQTCQRNYIVKFVSENKRCTL